MNYISAFSKFLLITKDDNRPQIQILSDLNLLASELRYNLEKQDKHAELLKYSEQDLKSYSSYIALEYNNALLFSLLKPDNFIALLKKAVTEKRYYFFSTASEIILSSKLNTKLKNELISYVDSVNEDLGLTPGKFDHQLYDEIILITNKVLEIAIENWYLFKTITKNVIEPFTIKFAKDVTDYTSTFKIEDLKILYDEILYYDNSLGLKN